MTQGAIGAWRNILFDFDGTLVDSSPLHAEAYRRVLERRRPDLSAGFDYEPLKGKTTRAGFTALGVAETDIETCSAEKQALFRQAVAAGQMAVMPGAAELLAALAADGHRLFLVTSGSRGSVSEALKAIGWTATFGGIVTADDVSRGKPDPEPFLHCLSEFALDPAQSVVVEDALSGVRAARAAALAVIAVHDGTLMDAADLFFPDLWSLGLWAER